uniref:Uncharacterized protein n=1 Tax=Arundo donax TaxID=35708 RepID=A0A0A8YB02_ARUDO
MSWFVLACPFVAKFLLPPLCSLISSLFQFSQGLSQITKESAAGSPPH